MIFIEKHGNTMKSICCNNCGCKFLYQESDILTEETRINAYDSEIEYRYIKCPECNNIIKL
jgi:DNA-directed RNA polymerase subunit RPC12/RpoP